MHLVSDAVYDTRTRSFFFIPMYIECFRDVNPELVGRYK